MGVWSKLKRGAKEASKSFGEGQFTVNGHKVTCTICGNIIFSRSTAQLNSSVATFFNFDWANRTANTLVCSSCSHVSWFLQKPKRTTVESDA